MSTRSDKKYEVDKRNRTRKFYLLTRFMFAFHLIALFFGTCALFIGLLALCSRIGSFLSSGTCSVALFFQTLTAALMTYALPHPLLSYSTIRFWWLTSRSPTTAQPTSSAAITSAPPAARSHLDGTTSASCGRRSHACSSPRYCSVPAVQRQRKVLTAVARAAEVSWGEGRRVRDREGASLTRNGIEG